MSNIIDIALLRAAKEIRDHNLLEENGLLFLSGAHKEFKMIIGPHLRRLLLSKGVSPQEVESKIAQLSDFYASLHSLNRNKRSMV